MYDNSRKFEVVIRPNGKSPADEYWHRGNAFIEGRDGSSYTIDVTNHTYKRALAIVSVDGLCVLDGKTAGSNSAGYVLNAGEKVSIPGWKVSSQSAAEFFFSKNGKSYASSKGKSANNGVIGAMFFEEYVKPWNSWESQGFGLAAQAFPKGKLGGMGALRASGGSPLSHVAQNSISVGATLTSSEVGTGFGQEVDFKTQSVDFVKDKSIPAQTVIIYYDSLRNLERMGIPVNRKSFSNYRNPFPEDAGCSPPPGWTGKHRY